MQVFEVYLSHSTFAEIEMIGDRLKPLALICFGLAIKFNHRSLDLRKDRNNNEPDVISLYSEQVI